MTAKLPRKFEQHNLLNELPLDTIAYTMPWAMAVMEDGDCYLNGRYPFYKEPGGTVQMQVQRTHEGYKVKIPAGETYNRSRGIPWVGATESDLIPVVDAS